MTRIGVVTPAVAGDASVVARAVRRAGADAVELPGTDRDLAGVDAVILTASVASGVGPILAELVDAAGRGLPVLGIGDGFGALCEAGALPGRLAGNAHGRFVARDVTLRVETRDTVWTCLLHEGQEVTLPFRTDVGAYTADEDTLRGLVGESQVVLRYTDVDPSGASHRIAGVTNARGTVVGLVPHPEHAADPLTGPSTEGLLVLDSVLAFVRAAA